MLVVEGSETNEALCTRQALFFHRAKKKILDPGNAEKS
jgi:hypothetical protein